MIKIIHITPHAGGGVGNVISKLSTANDGRMKHKVILLEKPVKNFFVNQIQDAGVEVLVSPNAATILKNIEECDIVIIHWWHHPKTSRFLYDFPQIPARVIIWSHISNLTVPALNPNILLKATRVLLTTEASYEAEIFSNIREDILRTRTGVVYGCGGFDNFPEINRQEHDGFNIGYLGLIDFSKLHPDFIEFCKAVKIDNAKFILAGDAPIKEYIENQVEIKGVQNEFIYKGYVNDVIPVLSEFDVLGYPLMPFHTCTTENSVLEAMAAEVPPVLLNQLTERYIVQNEKTGILVSSIEEYGNAMRYLYMHPNIRKAIGKNAREYVLKKYTLNKFIDSFYENCEAAMNYAKNKMDFKKYLGETPAEWLISCLGKDAKAFQVSFEKGVKCQGHDIKQIILSASPLLKQENKSSVIQYQREFPSDAMLNLWTNIMKEGEKHEY